jgi:cyclase
MAHQNARQQMEAGSDSSFWNERHPPAETGALPVLTFQESITLYFNDDEVNVSHLTGHTDGDVIVYFRKANVIHLGDIVFNGIFPIQISMTAAPSISRFSPRGIF